MLDDRRRSSRLWLTIPLRIEGFDSDGRAFESGGRAQTLSRHGARIQVPKQLHRGQTVKLKSPLGHFESEFAVVNAAAADSDERCEYGLKCRDESENFWGIEFPSAAESSIADATALLECRICHTVALVPLTLSEVETLRTLGLVGKLCESCAAVSPWRYAEVRVPMNRSALATSDLQDGSSPWFSAARESLERGHRRAYLQMPIDIRDSRGEVDVSQTENISRCGFCFVSDRKYLRGEIVMLIYPADSIAEQTELAARIVREQPIEGSSRCIYGATFEPRNCKHEKAA